MVLDEVGGGGGTATPTTTTNTTSGTTAPSTTTTTAPAGSTTAPSTTTTTAPAGTRRRHGTFFNRRPLRDPDATSLSDAARRNASNTNDRPAVPTSADAADRRAQARRRRTDPSTTAPVEASDVERAVNERRGRETTNDGRADDGVQSGGHKGARDVTIETLKERQKELQKERTELRADIGKLEVEIKSDEKKVGVVGTVVDVMSAPIGGLLSALNGGSNPIGDAAEGVAGRFLGLEDDKKKLEQQERELADQAREIAKQIDQLEDERTLNFLADVAHVTKMPEPIADVLEGASSLKINVVEETSIGSDAAYDSQTDEIVVDDDVLKKVEQTIATLREDGIVDADGNIIDAAAFDAHVAGDTAIGATVLIGVHEVIHGSQDMEGKIADAARAGRELISETRQRTRRFGEEDSQAMVDHARYKAELQRIDAVEYDAYVMQESIELQSGKEKKVFTTINPDGTLLERQQAVENIFALQLGMPMLHGVSRGLAVGQATHDHEHGEGHDHETGANGTGGRFSGGDDSGGRFSGGDSSGGRFSGGDDTGGRFSGGDSSGGRFSGGDLFAAFMSGGRFSGGDDTGGRFSGGDLLDD